MSHGGMAERECSKPANFFNPFVLIDICLDTRLMVLVAKNRTI